VVKAKKSRETSQQKTNFLNQGKKSTKEADGQCQIETNLRGMDAKEGNGEGREQSIKGRRSGGSPEGKPAKKTFSL